MISDTANKIEIRLMKKYALLKEEEFLSMSSFLMVTGMFGNDELSSVTLGAGTIVVCLSATPVVDFVGIVMSTFSTMLVVVGVAAVV